MAQKSTNTAPKLFLVVLIVALIAVAAWYLMPKGDQVPEHIGSGNGRIEATEVDIATRIPGRLESFEVRASQFAPGRAEPATGRGRGGPTGKRASVCPSRTGPY